MPRPGVKKIFGNKELERELDKAGYQFSSANSINIGRLVPQVAYYVYAYAQLLKKGAIRSGEIINVTVPTGKLRKYSGSLLCKTDGNAHRKADLRVQ